MEPTITSTSATLGASVTDIDLAELDDATWTTVEIAFHEFGVLIFPGQHLSEEAQGAFAARFGEIEQLAPNVTTVSISNQIGKHGPCASQSATSFQPLGIFINATL